MHTRQIHQHFVELDRVLTGREQHRRAEELAVLARCHRRGMRKADFRGPPVDAGDDAPGPDPAGEDEFR